MKTQLAKWGNSLAVRIPANLAKEARLVEGSEVDLAVSGGRLVMKPLSRSYSLEELVNAITEENRHDETDWGKPVGKEVW